MRVIILIDWGTCRNALQVAEHLVGIGICLLLLTIVAIALDAIIGLVEPGNRTIPEAVGPASSSGGDSSVIPVALEVSLES